MPGLFKGSEIVQIAIQIEKNGEAYYSSFRVSVIPYDYCVCEIALLTNPVWSGI